MNIEPEVKKDRFRKVLLLNADYTPIDIISWQRGLRKTFDTDSSVYVYKLHDEEFIMDSKGRMHQLPSIIVLKKYVKKSARCPYTKLNVFLRDDYTCQYCNQKFKSERLTIDHVIPRSKFNEPERGTASVFTNTVTCCNACNAYKADNLLGVARYPKNPKENWLQARAGSLMFLKKKPAVPSRDAVFRKKLTHTEIPDEWRTLIV